jgi:hypothetical protein
MTEAADEHPADMRHAVIAAFQRRAGVEDWRKPSFCGILVGSEEYRDDA